MLSKSFETQQVREIGRKEARESSGFPILWMGIIDVFQIKGKECKDQEGLKMCTIKSMPERGRCFSMREATWSGPVAVDEKRCMAAGNILAEEKGRAKGRIRLSRARGSAELGKVASGSAAQGLWLGDRKVGSQVISEDRNRFPGRRKCQPQNEGESTQI